MMTENLPQVALNRLQVEKQTTWQLKAQKEMRENVTGKWKKGDPCYMYIQWQKTLTKLYPAVIWILALQS